MTPADLLATARGVLDREGLATLGGWPRAVALLTRQALEQALDQFWEQEQATTGLRHCPMKTQLVCLPAYLEPGLAREINYVWAALSNACHYHAYDLAPAAGELSGWMTAVTRLIAAVAVSQPPQPSG